MTHYPTPANAQCDLRSLLIMARNVGIRFNETERVVFRPARINFTQKQNWVLNELRKWHFAVQLEIPIPRQKYGKPELNNF